MPQRPHIASLALLCLGVGASCFNEATAPSLVPTRSLDLARETALASPVGPVSVLFSSSSPVGVVFDRPLRGAGEGAAVPARLMAVGGREPAGTWRWVGRSAVTFTPSPRLPLATEYEITVPAGVVAQDGTALSAPYISRFTTDRPALASLEPGEGQISRRPTFEAHFNQAVSLEEVERAAHILVGDDKERRPLSLKARWEGSDAKARVLLTPIAELPPAATVELALDESLHGLEGPLPSGKTARFSMRTHGPLAVVSAHRLLAKAAGRCSTSGVELELSNPVTVGELQAHVHLSPAAPISWNREDDDALTKVDLHAPLAPARKYEVVVSAGMKDIYGQVLARGTSRVLDADLSPLLEIGEQEVFAAEGPRGPSHDVAVQSNVAAYDLLAAPLNETSLARYLAEATPGASDPLAEASRLLPQARVEAVRRPSPFGPPDVRPVSIDALLAADRGRGAALVVAETQGPTRAGTHLGAVRLVSQTDLRMTARVGLRGATVWVDRLSTGKPVAGAIVAVRDATGAEVVAAHTDESGMAVVPTDQKAVFGEGGSVDPRSILVARAGDDWTFRPLGDDLESPCREPARSVASVSGVLLTDRTTYELGETIHAKGFFREERPRGEVAPRGRSVLLSVTGASGNVVSTTEGKLDSYGGFVAAVVVPSSERPGPWGLRAEVSLGSERATPGSEPSGASGVATASIRIVPPARPVDAPAGVARDFERSSRAPATGPAPPARGTRAAGSPGPLALTADKDRYEVGQTATVRLESPFPEADVFVSVEGAGPPRGERVHVVGPTPTLAVAITENMAPAGHLAVMLSRTPGAAPAPEGAPSLALGQLDLRVATAPRGLRVHVTPTTQSPAPGGTLEADVIVSDPAGVPVRASVTFAAVDDVALPDPLALFDARRPLASFWVDSRADMGHAVLAARDPEPLPARGPGPLLVADAPERVGRTAYFDGELLTDVTGRAHVELTVPAESTSLRLRAVAATEDARFGFGEAAVDTSPPLGVEIDAPTLVRAGDQFEVRATVGVRGPGRGESEVDLSVAALGLDVGADVRRKVTVPAGSRVETRWQVRATEVGRAELVFRARAGDQVAESVLARRVEDPSDLESVVLYGETSDEASEHFGDWAHVRPDDGALDLKVSATALVGLDDGVEQILRYPYEDTEQHATRLGALVGLPDLLKDFRVVLPSDVGLLVQEEVADLLAAEQPDGSFAAWPGWAESRGGVAWRSAQALWALNAAALRDHKVPEEATSRAMAFVKQSLATWDRSPSETSEAALSLDVLTELGVGEGERILALYQAREHEPLFVRALLAHAMTLEQMDESKVEELLKDLDSHLRTTAEGSIVVDAGGPEYAPLHDSVARATAMVLRALVARAKARAPNLMRKVRPSELTARVAKGLLSLRRDGVWRTPEETLWALRALEDYRAAHVQNHADADAIFYLNGVELLNIPLHDRKTWQTAASFGMRKAIGAAAPGGILGFRVKGDGVVHYEARLRYAKDGSDGGSVDRGLAVDKRIELLAPGVAGGSSGGARRGDRVAVEVLVVTPVPLDRVVIDDPLPGGLVALEDGGTSVQHPPGVEPHFEAKGGRVFLYVEHLPPGISTFRYLALASVAGRFVVPATRATCRDAPEVFGRTRTSELEVRE